MKQNPIPRVQPRRDTMCDDLYDDGEIVAGVGIFILL